MYFRDPFRVLARLRFVGALLAVAGSCAAISAPASAQGWSIQPTPVPAGAVLTNLLSVSCPSSRVCTAVGIYATSSAVAAVAERWNGSRWTIEHTPNPVGATSSALSSVSCTSRAACIAVGSDYGNPAVQYPLVERWNGSSWSIEATPNSGSTYDGNLQSVSCPSRNDCLAVGTYTNSVGETAALAEQWNGSSWTVQSPQLSPDLVFLDGVSCPSSTDCMAVGTTSQGQPQLPVAYQWNGVSWSVTSVPVPPNASQAFLEGVSCKPARTCTAVGIAEQPKGDLLVLAERWDGSNWTVQNAPNPAPASADQQLDGVSCSSEALCTAVGTDNNVAPAEADVERANGPNWTVQDTPSPTGGELYGVSCPSAVACTAVGTVWSPGFSTSTPLAERWNGS